MPQNGAVKWVHVQLGVEGASREPIRYALMAVPLPRERTEVARVENANASGSHERRPHVPLSDFTTSGHHRVRTRVFAFTFAFVSGGV